MAPPKVTITVDDSILRQLIADTKGPAPVRLVADGVEYGLYQEMGPSEGSSRQWRFKPFMRPAVEQVRPTFVPAMKGALTLAQVTKVISKAAFDVERFAKVNAPWETGALRNSIHVVKADGEPFTFEVPA